MIVTIGGKPGSGKTTVSQMLAEELGFELVLAGEIFRDQARKKGMSLEEYGKRATEDEGIDRTLDSMVVDKVLAISNSGLNVVADGRLTGEMLCRNDIQAFKVWIDADKNVRADRISGRDGISPEDALRGIEMREEVERRRYLKIYGINVDDLSNYDLVVDSSSMTPDEVLEEIVDGLKRCAGI